VSALIVRPFVRPTRRYHVAIAVQTDFRGGTLEQYDRVSGVLGYPPNGPGAPGGLFHWVTKTDDGIRITDVWQDKETFERFLEAKLAPAMEQAGVDLVPEIRFFDVHNYHTPA
jgi:hypothetical protein